SWNAHSGKQRRSGISFSGFGSFRRFIKTSGVGVRNRSRRIPRASGPIRIPKARSNGHMYYVTRPCDPHDDTEFTRFRAIRAAEKETPSSHPIHMAGLSAYPANLCPLSCGVEFADL